LTIRESARSTDVRSTRVNDWQPEAADLPLRWVGRRGPGRLLVSRPVSPHRPSGWCAARGSARKPRHREPPVPSGAGVRKVRPSTSARLNHVAGTEASAARRSIQGAARRQRRAAESHGSALREGPPPPGARSSIATERLWTVRCPQGHPKSSHRDTFSAVAGCFGLVRAAGERIAQALFGAPEPPRSTRWCQRRPRLERLDPGSGRMQRRRTPAFGQGAETSNASVLSGGQKIARPSRFCVARASVYSPHRLTAVYAARTRSHRQVRSPIWRAIAGSPETSADSSSGMSRLLGDIASRLQTMAALRRPRDFPAARV
jgi:hypothetical protein